MFYTDTSRVKEIHLDTLREIMRKQRRATKAQLAKLSGLSIVTVNALVKELCEKGELTEYAVQTASTGRPAMTYCFNSTHHLTLVICVLERDGEDRVFVSVNDLYGAYLYEAEYLLKEDVRGFLRPYYRGRYREVPRDPCDRLRAAGCGS